ncbi:hypothetical protein H696_04214 [Fonticula alba]|uniref:Uncharacterized protein n=1 Tax=Fonticula alba TaxID=691883 RepID=A0A058Z3F2_FONAL|nr:hypothetical protein H696_04214 [Fonticula alba]KCV68795.1 hypothetical protein H696_04214 [Fonticula alba]|eukprot:XP_009496366.1 hypothetical protein H696_04214 [Fonticula alba]
MEPRTAAAPTESDAPVDALKYFPRRQGTAGLSTSATSAAPPIDSSIHYGPFPLNMPLPGGVELFAPEARLFETLVQVERQAASLRLRHSIEAHETIRALPTVSRTIRLSAASSTMRTARGQAAWQFRLDGRVLNSTTGRPDGAFPRFTSLVDKVLLRVEHSHGAPVVALTSADIEWSPPAGAAPTPATDGVVLTRVGPAPTAIHVAVHLRPALAPECFRLPAGLRQLLALVDGHLGPLLTPDEVGALGEAAPLRAVDACTSSRAAHQTIRASATRADIFSAVWRYISLAELQCSDDRSAIRLDGALAAALAPPASQTDVAPALARLAGGDVAGAAGLAVGTRLPLVDLPVRIESLVSRLSRGTSLPPEPLAFTFRFADAPDPGAVGSGGFSQPTIMDFDADLYWSADDCRQLLDATRAAAGAGEAEVQLASALAAHNRTIHQQMADRAFFTQVAKAPAAGLMTGLTRAHDHLRMYCESRADGSLALAAGLERRRMAGLRPILARAPAGLACAKTRLALERTRRDTSTAARHYLSMLATERVEELARLGATTTPADGLAPGSRPGGRPTSGTATPISR